MLKSIVNGAEHDIVSIPMKGKNLAHANSDRTGSFLTWQKDKSTFTLNGSASADDSLPFSTMNLKAGTYTLSIHGLKEIGGGKTGLYLSGVDTVRVQTNRTYTITEDTTVTLRLVISVSDVSYDNEEITVMFNAGSTALPYEPYGYQNGWEIRDNQNRLIWGREDELQTTTGTLPFKGYGLDIKEYSIDGNMVQAEEKEYSITGTSPLDFQSNGSDATISISGNETQASNQAYTISGTSPLSFNADGTNLTALSMDGNMNQASSQPYTVSGTSPISFMNNGTTIDYTVSGNMLQSGTPTPTSPITPEETGELNENLAIIYSDSRTITDWYYYDVRLTNIIPAGTYTLSFRVDSKTGTPYGSIGRGTTSGYSADVTYINIGNDIPVSIKATFTLTESACVWARFLRTSSPSTFSYSVSKIRVEEGSIAYGYKIPITNGSTTYNIYLTEPLRKIGDYADTVNSDGSVTRVIKKIVLTGQETYVQNGSYPQFSMTFSNQSDYTIASDGDLVMSSHFKGIARGSIGSDARITTRSTRNGLMMSHQSSADASAFTEWVASQYASGTPVIAWYVLATAQTDTATVPTITPTSGNNTLSVDTTLSPSNITITSNSSVFPGNPIIPIECGVLSENLFDNNQITTNENGAERPGVELPAGTYSIYNTSSRAVYYRIGDSGTVTQVSSGNSKANIVANDTLHVWQYPKEDGVMVIEGATAPTEYEPYGKYKIPITVGSNTNNIFINQPIRKIGNYSDSISSDGVVTRNIKKLVFDGTESWSSYSGVVYLQDIIDYAKIDNIICMCTHYEPQTNVDSVAETTTGHIAFGKSANYRLNIHDANINNATDYKLFLAEQYANNTPVEVWYVLETPDTTETTTISTISTVNGANTLTTGTPITPSNITISTSSSVYPKNPIYPEECGDRTANLLPSPTQSTKTDGGITVTCDGNGVYTITSTGSGGAVWFNISEFTIPVSVGNGGFGTFSIFNSAVANGNGTIGFYYGNTKIDDWSFNSLNRTTESYNTMSGKTINKIRIGVSETISFTIKPMFTDDGQLPSDYEPYGYKIPITIGSNTNYIYTQEPIRKIGDYADVINSDGSITRYIMKLVLTGNEYIVVYRNNSSFTVPAASKLHESSSLVFNGFCSHYKQSTRDDIYYSRDDFCISPSGGDYQVVIRDTNCADATAFKAFLSEQYANNTPVCVWYIRNTPTTEQTTIPTLTTVDGKNTATIGTTLAPSSITINATSKVYPNNPIIPEMCGDLTENLFNINGTWIKQANTDTISVSGDTVTITSKYYARMDITLKPNTDYTYQFLTTKSSGIMTAIYHDSTVAANAITVQSDGRLRKFNTGEYTDILFLFYSSNGSEATESYSDIMLVEGEYTQQTMPSYEPYGWKIPLDNYEENLISLPTITTESDGLTVSSSSESMTLFGNITRIYEDNPIWKQFDFMLDAGEYTLSLGEPRTYQNGYAPRLHKYDDGSVLTNYLINPVTFTLSERTHVYMAFYIDDKQLYNDRWMFRLRNGSTVNEAKSIYLGEVPTIRRIKKLVLTGEENITAPHIDVGLFNIPVTDYLKIANVVTNICSHYRAEINVNGWSDVTDLTCRFYGNAGSPSKLLYIRDSSFSAVTDFKAYLSAQYQNGNPVTVWYVLAEPETGVINEQLCKISTYADELTTVQAHGLSAPLYGIGDYKDILNLSTGVVTRKIKKYEFTGNEEWNKGNYPQSGSYQFFTPKPSGIIANPSSWIITHFKTGATLNGSAFGSYLSLYPEISILPENASANHFKNWLAAQYANGTPVTIWYILETPETETVTVPTGMTGEIEGYLKQISTPTPEHPSIPKWNGEEETGGTYAVTVYTPPEIQTVSGKNTITVRTEIPPSDFTIKAHARETGITEVHYGFKINKSVENSNDAVSYMYDAVTMTPAYMDYDNDEFNYGSWENAFFVKDCYPVALNLNGTEAYKLDPNDYTKKLNGEQSDIQFTLVTEEPSDWSTQWKQYYTKDSNDNYNINDQESEPTFTPNTYYKLVYNESFTGNFMMAFPKVWFYRHEDSSYNYVEISNCKLSDDWRCYAHVNRYGEEVDYIYLPLFKGVIKDSKLRSLPGQIPHGSSTAMEEVAAASALGNRWQLWDHSSMECINDLLILMSKSIDSQTAFGNGVDKPIDFDNTYTYGKLQTGTLVKSGKFKGFSSTVKDIKVFGMEGLWSNRFDRMQGMLLVDNVWKIKMTPPYNFSGTDFLPLSNAEVPDGSGYISRVQTSEYGSIPASILNGSQDVFYKDYFFKNASGTRVAIHGGYCRNGSPCGFRCIGVNFDANSGPSWATDGVGASPVYK